MANPNPPFYIAGLIPQPGGTFQRQLVGAIDIATSPPILGAGKVVILNQFGQIDSSLISGGGGGGSVSVNGTSVSNPNLKDNASVVWHVSGSDITATATGSSTAFQVNG